MSKEKIFSVTAADCDFQFFTAGGKGGQHQNKTASACRCVHKASGAVGECREHREQGRNKKEAFRRMAETKEFKTWLDLEVKKQLGQLKVIEQEVERELKRVKVEVRDKNGRWIDEKDNQE